MTPLSRRGHYVMRSSPGASTRSRPTNYAPKSPSLPGVGLGVEREEVKAS